MFFDLPYGAKVDKYMGGMATTEWHTWNNPRNEYNNAIILAAGAGGGAGGGYGFGYSGSGGGSGGFGHIYCPLSLLPDTLYIQVGLGGSAGLGGSNGTSGNTTYVSIYPNSANTNLLMSCSGGGFGYGGFIANLAGAGGVVTIYNTLGIAQGYTGTSGSIGKAPGVVISSILPTTGNPIYGGAGGGNNVAGGGMTSVSSLYPSVTGGAIGQNGSDGFVIWKPFTVFGGCGGGGSANANGGSGIMGSGGGGGGCSNSDGNVSNGGSGGNGFVIIICY
jgi:hypothetical protein